ncbi:MAG: transglutaminase family protein [Candidatus Obscuribacterales bacterium]|nr:transglutaminase family protein [Candidatus Obscuribacterales bacterium]
MLLSITHQTDLNYSDYISESVMELRMAPRQEKFQHRLSFNLAIGPASKVKSYFDWLGNSVHAFSINALHDKIQIIATSVVETISPAVQLEALPDHWQRERSYDYTLYDFLLFGGPVVDTPSLRELSSSILDSVAAEASSPKVGDLILAMLRKIDTDFVYEKGITTSASPITEILEHGRGVCQDFTHLMVGLARSLNIPARYVSGYIHPDHERFRGYAQTHAWVEIFVPSLGWVGVDPTNNCIAGENFVKVAVGRNYQDVPPNKGVYKGEGKETIEVAVHSEQLNNIPIDLAAERTEALNIPVFAGNIDEIIQQIRQQQEQQQQ